MKYYMYIALLSSLIFGVVAIQNSKPDTLQSNSNAAKVKPVGPFSQEQVAMHSSENDCWQIIADKVYDVTNYIPLHPGQPATIIRGCGKDATELFSTRPDTKAEGRDHGSFAYSRLEDFYIGELAK